MIEIVLVLGKHPEKIFNSPPLNIFDERIISFFGDLSKTILRKNKFQSSIKELFGFFFWSRKKNLLKLKNEYQNHNLRFGRGSSLHIAPSNISSNTLYTLLFGLLSGSPSIVRVSEKNLIILDEIFVEMGLLIKKKEYEFLLNYLSIIKYEHSDEINKYLSLKVNNRIIWGGDETIMYFKQIKTLPSCIDIPFPNRVSSCVIDFEKLNKLDVNEYKKQVLGFAKDISLFSQRACSSPFFMFTNKFSGVGNQFFFDVDDEIKKSFKEEVNLLSNFKSSSDMILSNPLPSNIVFKGERLFILKTPQKDIKNFKGYKPSFCCLVLIEFNKVSEILNLLIDSNQTIVQIPFEDEDIRDKLISISGKKINNRIVSAGNALNMHLRWDGIDIISMLTNYITLE